MSILIIDSSLKNQSGHCFQYSTAVLREFCRRGISAQVIGNQSANKECLSIKGFVPHFSDSVTRPIKGKGKLEKAWHLVVAIRAFVKDLDRLLAVSSVASRDYRAYFVHTFREYEFFAWALWAYMRLRRGTRLPTLQVFFVLRFSHIKPEALRTLVSGLLYVLSFRLLHASIGRRLVLFTDSELLSAAYRKLLRTEVHVLPIPIAEEALAFTKKVADSSAKSDRVVIGFVGGARRQKGIDLFISAIVAESVEQKGKSVFHVQIDTSGLGEIEREFLAPFIARLTSLTGNPRIKILYGQLSDAEYYEYILACDIICLPYRSTNYHAATSSILVESVILGRVPVVSNNNWLSFELSKHQLGGLTFDLGSSVDIQTAIAGVVANYEFWRSRLRLLQTNWIAFHSASSLVRVLLEHFMYVNSQLPVSDEAFP